MEITPGRKHIFRDLFQTFINLILELLDGCHTFGVKGFCLRWSRIKTEILDVRQICIAKRVGMLTSVFVATMMTLLPLRLFLASWRLL